MPSSSNVICFLICMHKKTFIIIMGGGWRFDITGLLAPPLTSGSAMLQMVRCVSSTNSWASREASGCRRMSGIFILTPMFSRLANSDKKTSKFRQSVLTLCTNRFLLSNAPSGDVCVLPGARHVVRTIIRIPVPTEFQRRSLRIRLSRYIRVSCCMVWARHVVLSSLYRTFI